MVESDNSFVQAYRKHIGPGTPDEAIGYWIFLVGALLGLLGVIAYFYSTTFEGTAVYTPREVAAVSATVGLTFLLLGVVIRLPTHKGVTMAGIVGAVISVLAAVWFSVTYPDDWPTPEGDPTIVGMFALGAAILVAAAIIMPAVVKTPEDVFEDLAPAKIHSKGTFEVFRDPTEEHRWRLRHEEGTIVGASSEGYTSKQEARKDLERARKNIPGAGIQEITSPEDAAQASFEVYEDNAGQWRWRLRHDNGNIIADSGEGYADRSGVDDAVERVRSYADIADTLTLDDGAFDLYEDEAGEWRWRLLARNGRIIADSGEGYSTRSNGQRAIESVRDIDAHDFEVYEDDEGRYRWRLLAGNNEIIADSGQGYSDERGAKDAVERVKEAAPIADTLTMETGAFEMFEDAANEWRWRLLAPNGEIIADSGEGYSSQSKARQGLRSVHRNAPRAPVKSVGSTAN